MKRVYEIADDFSLPIANMFHAGDGNLHPLMLFDRHNKSEVERVLEASKRSDHLLRGDRRRADRRARHRHRKARLHDAGLRRATTWPRWPGSSRPSILRPCSTRKRSFPSGYVCGEVRALRAQAIAQKHGIYPM